MTHRIQPSTPKQHPPTNLQRPIHSPTLLRCLRPSRREPIHGIHKDGDSERLGLHTREDLRKLIGMDADVVQRAGRREFGMRSWRQVCWMTASGVMACDAQRVSNLARIMRSGKGKEDDQHDLPSKQSK